MSFYVRRYINDDYPVVTAIWEATGTGGAHRGDDQNSIKNTLQSGGELFVLVDNDSEEIIGTSWITNDGRRLYLHHFAILQEYQSKGLSHLLMEASLKFAKEKNIQIKLEVHKNNEIALNLYKNYGFGYLGDYEVYIIRDLSIIKD